MSSQNIHNGPQAQQVSNDGIAQFAQQMANKPTGGGDGNNGDVVENSYKLVMKALSLIGIKVNIPSIFKTGALAQFTPPAQSGIEKPMMQGGYGAKGGAIAQLVGNTIMAKPDFSKIAPLDVPRLEVKDAPVDTSFPSQFANGGGRGGGGGFGHQA